MTDLRSHVLEIMWFISISVSLNTGFDLLSRFYIIKNVQKLYLKTIHSNTNNTSSIELLNRLSNKHKIVTENMHDSTYNTARHI